MRFSIEGFLIVTAEESALVLVNVPCRHQEGEMLCIEEAVREGSG
jgi:hypothetical protein